MVEHGACVEVKLQVAAEMVQHPLGFVVDAGGSLTKCVYRSKEDYEQGKPLKPMDSGVLRLKSFTIEQISGLEEFIKDHVDIALTEEHQDVTWWQTGITAQHFKTRLESALNIKTKLFLEFESLVKCLEKNAWTQLPIHKTCVESIEVAAHNTSIMMEMMTKLEARGVGTKDSGVKTPAIEKAMFPVLPAEHYLKDLATTDDHQAWIDRNLKRAVLGETPILVLLLGSAGVLSRVDENFEMKFLDYFPSAAKTLSAVAEEMIGEKVFSRFIELAEQGDTSKVDQTAKDIKNQEHTEEDWYSIIHADLVAFELGKLSSNNFKGRGEHSKADLAAGLLSWQLHTLSKMLIMNIRISRTFDVYVCGSMFQFPHVRKTFEKHFYSDSILASLEYGRPFTLHFFENPGYLVALGVWIKNVEEEKEREMLKSLAKM